MKVHQLAITSALFLSALNLYAHENKNSRADSHAPIGVMGDHLHKKGEWMMSYRYMNMQMDGMLSGKDGISADQIAVTANPLAGEMMRMGNLTDGSPRIMMVPPDYRVAPIDMSMEMHMLGGMYGWSDDLTLMLMIPVVKNDMSLRSYGGASGTNSIGVFDGESSGIGDVKLSAMIRFSEEGNLKSHFNIGLSFPTGSTTEKGNILPPFAGMMTPAGETVDIDRIGYSMQLGSGSYDLLPAFTIYDRNENIGWGTQINAVIRLDNNDEGYRLGNRLELQTWISNQWQSWVSGSIKLKAYSLGQIRGRDEVITGGMPLFYAGNSGRDQVEFSVGINLLGENEIFKGHRLAIEAAKPIYQKVNGLQMENNWNVTFGWQKAF
ncbi:MAG: transporter [Kangiellaceae bacterium]